jgi:hypothetical protein
VVGLAAGIGLLLSAMWGARIVEALLRPDGAGLLFGGTTMVIQAMDLGLVVPLAALTAWLAWRGDVLGYVLSAVLTVKALAMGAAICAMLLGSWAVEGKLAGVPLLTFTAVSAYAVYLGLAILRATREEPADTVPSTRAPLGARHPA